jgi:acylphosphatase
MPLSATIFGFVTETKQAKRFLVSGFVQGVGFRYFAQRVADKLQLHGYVRNLRDGRVEAYAIGTPGQLADFRDKLQRGPMAASVANVTEEDEPIHPQYEDGFAITYDA